MKAADQLFNQELFAFPVFLNREVEIIWERILNFFGVWHSTE